MTPLYHNLYTPPLSLYIHLPWCIQKCFYCDFNSHAVRSPIPEDDYVETLLRDLETDLKLLSHQKLTSIFFGGGTPSLFSSEAITRLLQEIRQRIAWYPNIEITLEANPGTFEQRRFLGFRQAGINRLSLGCQSFQNDKLKTLGRVHGKQEALLAAKTAKMVGFDNINLDLMFGLPEQTIAEALTDLQIAIDLEPTHISWYQLTLEPNTFFYQHPPVVPDDEILWEMQTQGQKLLRGAGYLQYEVSAYSKPDYQCQHNLNYWLYGDYLGIGAGAHSKLSDPLTSKILRLSKVKHPKTYLNTENFIETQYQPQTQDIIFEFMLNALRLNQAISTELFETRTNLPFGAIEKSVQKAKALELIEFENNEIIKTALGSRL